MAYRDELESKIKVLSETIWDHRAKAQEINAWLDNFAPATNDPDDERLHALYLLSHFMYFGSMQMRSLMQVLYRDLYKYPIVEKIRRSKNDTTDLQTINRAFAVAFERTLFLGVGNPSESGCHLLYYFRQENRLPKSRFIHSHQIFQRRRVRKRGVWRALLAALRERTLYGGTLELRNQDIDRYVFIDDFCGSGHQGKAYSKELVEDIKALNPNVEVSYFALFATTDGLETIKNNTAFDVVGCIFEFDRSFRCFDPSSRYFPADCSEISQQFAESTCRKYGARLVPNAPLGYGDCQLLIGFHHNTPDNTLPIFWYDEDPGPQWTPIFKRYPKNYG